jgi:hypothetical protein
VRWEAIALELFSTSETEPDFEAALWFCTQKDVYSREQYLEHLRKTPSDFAILISPNHDQPTHDH